MTLPPPINTGRGRGPRFNTHWVRRNVLIKKINKLDVNINAFIYWALKSITTFAFCRRWHGVLLNVAFKFSGGWKIKRTIVPGMIFIILWSDYMLGIIGQIKRMVFFFFFWDARVEVCLMFLHVATLAQMTLPSPIRGGGVLKGMAVSS